MYTRKNRFFIKLCVYFPWSYILRISKRTHIIVIIGGRKSLQNGVYYALLAQKLIELWSKNCDNPPVKWPKCLLTAWLSTGRTNPLLWLITELVSIRTWRNILTRVKFVSLQPRGPSRSYIFAPNGIKIKELPTLVKVRTRFVIYIYYPGMPMFTH